jgi:hypothetical protein
MWVYKHYTKNKQSLGYVTFIIEQIKQKALWISQNYALG